MNKVEIYRTVGEAVAELLPEKLQQLLASDIEDIEDEDIEDEDVEEEEVEDDGVDGSDFDVGED